MYINSHGDCVTCDKDFFCPQGQDPVASTKTACPRNMVTLKPGAKNNGAWCVHALCAMSCSCACLQHPACVGAGHAADC